MSDICMDYDFNVFGKEKETSRIWETGNEKKDNRRILDDDRDVILHRPAPDERLAPDEEDLNLKEHEQSKKLATSNEDYVDLVEKGPVLETSGGNATKFSCTSEKSDRRRTKAKIQIFISTVFYGITRAKFLSVRLILLLLMFGNVIGPEMKNVSCLQITPYEVVTNFTPADFKLECVCRCNKECVGNKQWAGGPNKKTLCYNSRVFEDSIKILEQTAHTYFMIIKNATQNYFNSNYTCSFGVLSKKIILDEYDKQSTQASTTVSSITSTRGPDDRNNESTQVSTSVSSIISTHGQDDGNNGGLSGSTIAGIVVGVIVVAVVAVAVVVCICRKLFDGCRCQSPSREVVAQEDNEL